MTKGMETKVKCDQRVISMLRCRTALTEKMVSDKQLLKMTKGTQVRAAIDLHIAMIDFSKAASIEVNKVQTDIKKALSGLSLKNLGKRL